MGPYATENPAEFFAVVEESYGGPEQRHQDHDGTYQQLRLYYRQDPRQRLYNNRSL